MNWDEVEGQWKQVQGKVREKWGKLTDNDVHVIGGKKDQFLGKLQERYGMSRSQAEKELDNWMTGINETETPKTRTSGGSERA